MAGLRWIVEYRTGTVREGRGTDETREEERLHEANRNTGGKWLTTQDNLVVQWGVQDNYEIVRKVGRGKYSEVS